MICIVWWKWMTTFCNVHIVACHFFHLSFFSQKKIKGYCTHNTKFVFIFVEWFQCRIFGIQIALATKTLMAGRDGNFVALYMRVMSYSPVIELIVFTTRPAVILFWLFSQSLKELKLLKIFRETWGSTNQIEKKVDNKFEKEKRKETETEKCDLSFELFGKKDLMLSLQQWGESLVCFSKIKRVIQMLRAKFSDSQILYSWELVRAIERGGTGELPLLRLSKRIMKKIPSVGQNEALIKKRLLRDCIRKWSTN